MNAFAALGFGLGWLRPELLLLALPLGWLVFTAHRGQHAVTTAVRAVAAIMLVCAIAGPYLRSGSNARHVVFVVDRSASMPAGAEDEANELIELALAERESEDLVHVVAFGESATIERTLDPAARGFDGFQRDVGVDGSDLTSALETALSLVPDGTRGSIVVLSDGEVEHTAGVEAASLAAAARAVRIDVREVGRLRTSDTAIERVEIPGEVDVAEPFFVTAWVRSDERQVRKVRLTRNGVRVAEQVLQLGTGRTRVRFRDRLDRGGTAKYVVEVVAGDGAASASDRTPENDRAIAATRANGARPVLIVNDDGGVDTLTSALRRAGIPAVPARPEDVPRSIVGLDAFRAVIVQNVSAARMGLQRMEALRTWTLDHGGGLMMTGGKASFGSGGYFRSPLDELLPVSMELRQEHRKMAVALSVALDRSGSMSAPVAGGTKMDLANAGTVEALKLLSPMDSASVIAVDTSAHVIQPQTDLSDLDTVIDRTLGIQSTGGGIYTAVAVNAAARELVSAPQATKHLILFADAADAEQYDETPAEIQLLRDLGATLSVIALGTEQDQDAGFLKRCAIDGGGEIYFTQSASDLPRLFAMDTQSVARSTFIEEVTGVRSRPELFGLGEVGATTFPAVGGYNLTYLKGGASAGAVTTDEYSAPIVAFHPRGLGRVAAYTGQVGGTFGASLEGWDGFSSFFVTLVRWLTGVEAPAGVFAQVERDGRDAVLSIELDPSFDSAALGESITATMGLEDGSSREVVLERLDATRFEARHPLSEGQIAMTTVSLAGSNGSTAVPMPPVALPYSPEYERPLDLRAGQRLLRRVAARTGGISNVAAADVFRGDRGSARWRMIAKPLIIAALLLLLLEIAGRRLSLWETMRLSRQGSAGASFLGRRIRGSSKRVADGMNPALRQEKELPNTEPVEAGEVTEDLTDGDLTDALQRARRSAGGRLNR